MKKTFLILVFLIVSIALFAEGKQESTGAEKDITISFWMQQYGDEPAAQKSFLDRITNQFNQETGINVKYSIIDWGQALTKYTLASTGGQAPDVAETFFAYSQVKMGGENYGPMVIDDVVEEVGDDGFYEYAKAECFMYGHWYALPWRGDTRFAAYNEKHFNDAGIKNFPATYDQLIEIGNKLTQRDASGRIQRSGYNFRTANARFDQTWFSILAGHGGKLMDDNYEEFIFDSEPGRESLQFMQDSVHEFNIIPENVIDPSYDGPMVFMAEKSSIILDINPEVKRNVRNQAPQVAEVTRGAVMPSKTGDGISSIAFAAPVCVYKTTKHPEAAKEFLKFFVSEEVQLDAMKTLTLVNVWKDVMEDPFFSESDWYQAVLAQNKRAQPGDMPIPKWSQVDAFPQGPLNTMCTNIMAGNDIQESIDKAIIDIKKIRSE